jgi:hypothetical protein
MGFPQLHSVDAIFYSIEIASPISGEHTHKDRQGRIGFEATREQDKNRNGCGPRNGRYDWEPPGRRTRSHPQVRRSGLQSSRSHFAMATSGSIIPREAFFAAGAKWASDCNARKKSTEPRDQES